MSSDLTFKMNSEEIENTIGELTAKSAEIREMAQTAEKIIKDKLSKNGVPGDIAKEIIANYDMEVVQAVELNNASNDTYIEKTEKVNEDFRETQAKNTSLFN